MEPVAFAYIDDIIIATATYAEHLKWLEHVLKRINQAGLTINRDKSFFCRSEVKYLGVIVDKNGFRPDPDKIAPVTEMTAPKTLKQLRRFLGMASWYRKFLENFATIADPLNRLLKKNTKYIWGEEQQAAFERIKALIASAPMLSRPSFEHEFVVQTDASDSGLGAVLTQTIDGEEKVLCFASRTLNKAERNYSVTERECLAVLWAIQKFRPYVEGYRFRVITDHSSLRWLHNLRNPTGKLSRWSLELQQFDYIVEHRKGTNNVVPDALSRLYEDESDEAQVASIIINEKAEDSWYNKLLAKVKTDPTKYPYHKAIGSTLYHYRPDPFIDDVVDDQDAWKLIVPREKRHRVLFECHEEPTSGHLGRHKTYERLAMRYYWPSAHRDVTKYVRECQICQQCKVQQLAPAGLMGRRAVTRPWSVVAGDTMGPFPRSAQGNEYIIIFMDLFTRWIEAIPVRKANARTIRKHLLERVFLRFGAPEVFHSDNGTEYKNNLVDEFLTERGVIHSTIPIYTANANPVERVNRTYKTMMISYIKEDHKTWDEHIYELTFAFNTAVHDSTGVSPAFLNLGRNPEIGHSVRRKEAEAALIAEEDEARIAWAMRMENLSGIRDKATENSQQAQERQAQYYNKKRRDVTFKANDKVWRRNRILSSGAKGIAAKLGRRFRGPCKVSKVLGSNVYQLIGESGELVEKVTASDFKNHAMAESSTAESDERNSATANVTSVKSTTAAVSDERKSAATDVYKRVLVLVCLCVCVYASLQCSRGCINYTPRAPMSARLTSQAHAIVAIKYTADRRRVTIVVVLYILQPPPPVMSRLVLGIDVGTTSVKVVLVQPDGQTILANQSKDTQAQRAERSRRRGQQAGRAQDTLGHTQLRLEIAQRSVEAGKTIWRTHIHDESIHVCCYMCVNVNNEPRGIAAPTAHCYVWLARVDFCELARETALFQLIRYKDGRKVESIGICGQMHGVTLWKSDAVAATSSGTNNGQNQFKLDIDKDGVSHLYTWQDGRCDIGFLDSLPRSASHLALHTGYGCATLFWFAKNKSTGEAEEVRQMRHRAGPRGEPAVRLGRGPGAHEQSERRQLGLLLHRGLRLGPRGPGPGRLPRATAAPGGARARRERRPTVPQLVRHTQGRQHRIIIIIRRCIINTRLHFYIIITQFFFYCLNGGFSLFSPYSAQKIEYFPYFNDKYLAVAASLNGGNTLATFVKSLQQWILDLGFSVPQSKVWEKLIKLAADEATSRSDMQIVPTLLGERYAPQQTASVSGISLDTLDLGSIFRALCSGIIKNLHE
ncbi:unnamed protein product [Trichogramma brassicae]|uniref:RNA-directed DNA polymerase n=1 Tax=Trichogramma brassicae TaxID=86971 RepID=A0A6H5ITE6_9HYME|nr:unnamed protein product [Trichogramma brassicae]